MQILSLPGLLPAELPGDTCVALGFFDGVHRGHAAVLQAAAEYAKKNRLSFLVYTFAAADAPKGDAALLSDDGERAALFSSLGAEYCVFDDFSATRTLSPERFVSDILCGLLRARIAVSGEDFRFGHRAVGDVTLLSHLLADRGGRTVTVPPVMRGGFPISSSRVRKALALGDAAEAAALLGRPYALTLPVVHGQELGRSIGFPTANQPLPEGRAIPRDGVYVTECVLPDGRALLGVSDIGMRPTVAGKARRMESHLINFSGDLYGAPLTVRFLARLRDEAAFPTLSALTEQIKKDVMEAEKWKMQNGSN